MKKLFLDCGAWEGNSITYFREVYPDHSEYEIHSFECDPNSIKKLEQNFPDVKIWKVALWDADQERTLRTGDGRFSESSTLMKKKRIRRYNRKTNVRVQCINFSDWVREHCKPDDYVVCKLNVEGAEYRVLNKMLEDGTDKLIDEWWIEWHWSKMGMPEEDHLSVADRIDWKMWSLDHSRNVIYTVITDSEKYTLNEPIITTPGWDYVCFTNDKGLTSNMWEIKQLAYDSDPVKQSRKVKILNENYLPGYNLSVYIDARFTVKCNLDRFVSERLTVDYDMMVMKHNRRCCLYKEAEYITEEAAKKFPLELRKVVKKQITKYKNINMPRGYGLYAPGIMIRRHNEAVKKLCRKWYEEMAVYSSRDQLSLPFAMWKNPDTRVGTMPFKETYDMFMYRGGHRIAKLKG